MNIQKRINTLLFAIRSRNVDIKIDTVELYSEETKRYFKVYKVYIKGEEIDKKGQRVKKYMLQDEYISKIDLLKYLVSKYEHLKEGEASG